MNHLEFCSARHESKIIVTNPKGESKRQFDLKGQGFTCMTLRKCPYATEPCSRTEALSKPYDSSASFLQFFDIHRTFACLSFSLHQSFETLLGFCFTLQHFCGLLRTSYNTKKNWQWRQGYLFLCSHEDFLFSQPSLVIEDASFTTLHETKTKICDNTWSFKMTSVFNTSKRIEQITTNP